ncbi:MAG: DUF515 domain-containing protein [Thermococci archaeon]|nr:DUF515 domain-containing protein [Thermococci archaeon]
MSEDIEAKIRRLRELGKTSVSETEAPTVPAPSSKPPRRPRSRRIGSIRDRERRRRIIAGAVVLIIIILAVSFVAYSYYSSRAARELKNAKAKKIAEINEYFKGPIMNTSYGKANRTWLIHEVEIAKSVKQVNSINVKAAYQKVWAKYQQQLKEQQEKEQAKLLAEAKQAKLIQIDQAFQVLLSRSLPAPVKEKVLSVKKRLISQVMNSTTVDEVKSIDPTPYIVQLWHEYFNYEIDMLPGNYVTIQRGSIQKIYTKEGAKSYLASISDPNVLAQYTVSKVIMVQIALLVDRAQIVGGFPNPGSQIMVFAKNGTKYVEISNMGYLKMILLPSSVAQINANERQSQSSSSSSGTSSQASSSQQSTSNAGGASISSGQSASASKGAKESYTQSSSASYAYTVNLDEILKAIAAGKIQGSEQAVAQLKNYGTKLLEYEKQLQIQDIPSNQPFLVIIEVPSVMVPKILTYQNSIYIGEVVPTSG